MWKWRLGRFRKGISGRAQAFTHSGVSLSTLPPYKKTSYMYVHTTTYTGDLRMNCWSQAWVPLPPLTGPIFSIPCFRWSHSVVGASGSPQSPPAMENPHTLIKANHMLGVKE